MAQPPRFKAAPQCFDYPNLFRNGKQRDPADWKSRPRLEVRMAGLNPIFRIYMNDNVAQGAVKIEIGHELIGVIFKHIKDISNNVPGKEKSMFPIDIQYENGTRLDKKKTTAKVIIGRESADADPEHAGGVYMSIQPKGHPTPAVFSFVPRYMSSKSQQSYRVINSTGEEYSPAITSADAAIVWVEKIERLIDMHVALNGPALMANKDEGAPAQPPGSNSYSGGKPPATPSWSDDEDIAF